MNQHATSTNKTKKNAATAKKTPTKARLDVKSIKTIEVHEVEASPEDDRDDNVGVAPQKLLRLPKAPRR